MTDEGRYIPLEELDEETRREVIKTRRVIKLAGSGSTIRHIPYEQAYGRSFDDLPRRVPRLDRIRSLIGFAPRLALDAIIRSVIDETRAAPG